ncbi:MAG: carboxylesterase [Gammaproteobacteria bacterium]|nr:MAG: carboxylesterase [Gammaproteobacteria bacterium]
MLPCVEIEPKTTATASVIWLHGLGANGHDFEPIVPQLALSDELAVRFVFPHAPNMPVTINGGMVMPAWYDIYEMSIDAKIDAAGIKKSAELIGDLIAREIERGVSSERIALIGFSQGGAVVYECGLSYAKPLAGILGMSAYFATHDSLISHKANHSTPVAIHHGHYDQVVPEALGRQAERLIRALGNPVEYKSYAMEHSVCAEQIDDIADWLNRALAGVVFHTESR